MVVQIRGVCGGLAAFLSYPMFLELGVTSHFLAWLPIAIAVYAVYGTLLSFKKLKVFTECCLKRHRFDLNEHILL